MVRIRRLLLRAGRFMPVTLKGSHIHLCVVNAYIEIDMTTRRKTGTMAGREVVMASDGDRRLLSVEEAAAIIGVSRYTLRAWLREGRLAHIRLGRRVVLDPADLARFVDAGRVPARDEACR